MKSFGITDKGKVRSENQDSYIIENCDKRKCVIAVICDGMGGAKAGDLASRLSSKEFVSRVYERLAAPRLLMGNTEKLLRDSCADANGVVYEYSRFDANYSGMGTTLVGGIITRRKACLVNVGDSRAYYLSDDRDKADKPRSLLCRRACVDGGNNKGRGSPSPEEEYNHTRTRR